MKFLLSLFSVLASLRISTVWACGHGQHVHQVHKRDIPSVPLSPPTKPLVWSDVNIIHTTDSHGWLLGHQKASFPEPNYSGDFGDFASFVTHMKEIAVKKDVDFLLVDSGDLHDGTGLTDGFPAGGVDGQEAVQFIAQLPYDIMAIGNHELYNYAVALDMHQHFTPKLNGRYLTSNVNITLADENNKVINVPVGNRFVKFTTRKGRKVTSLGVLFDFTGNDKNTTVQKVEDMVEESWFKDVIQEEPDFFLLVGHMPVQGPGDSWPVVFNAIRAIHPTTPVLIFGGHTHIRDCVQLDDHSMALESGRYMETIGWMSVGLSNGSKKPLNFTRRYLDPNRVTYEYHTNQTENTFDTPKGVQISGGLKQLAQKFDLGFFYGTAPQDYNVDRAPYPSNNSLLSLYAASAAPVALTLNNPRGNIPNFIITNSGSQRFDVYSGSFTKNDQLTASPFTDTFLFIPDVALSIAIQVLAQLNSPGSPVKRALSAKLERRETELYEQGYVDKVYRAWLEEMDRRGGFERVAVNNKTLGYVTHDSCPGLGDDIMHMPLPFFSTPDFISSNPPDVSDDTPVDLIFIHFIEGQVIGVLNNLQTAKTYVEADVQVYSDVLSNGVLGVYAQQAWI